ACLTAFEQVKRDRRHDSRPLTAIRLPEAARADFAEALRPVRTALETGRGFAIVEGAPEECLPADEAVALYWLVGQGLGPPAAPPERPRDLALRRARHGPGPCPGRSLLRHELRE